MQLLDSSKFVAGIIVLMSIKGLLFFLSALSRTLELMLTENEREVILNNGDETHSRKRRIHVLASGDIQKFISRFYHMLLLIPDFWLSLVVSSGFQWVGDFGEFPIIMSKEQAKDHGSLD